MNKLGMMLAFLSLCVASGCIQQSEELSVAEDAPTTQESSEDNASASKSATSRPVDDQALADMQKDVAGLPAIPKLTGDKESDKRAILQALEELKTTWERNRNTQRMLEIRLKEKGDSPQLQKIRKIDAACSACAQKLQDLLEQLGD